MLSKSMFPNRNQRRHVKNTVKSSTWYSLIFILLLRWNSQIRILKYDAHQTGSYLRSVVIYSFQVTKRTKKKEPTRSARVASRALRTTSSSSVRWFFSSRTLIRSFRWSCNLSLASDCNLSTVDDKRTLCSSLSFSRCRAWNTTTSWSQTNCILTFAADRDQWTIKNSHHSWGRWKNTSTVQKANDFQKANDPESRLNCTYSL